MPGSASRSTTPSARRSPGAPSVSASGRIRVGPASASRTSGTSSSATTTSTRPNSSPEGPPVPSERWNAWPSSTSRGPRGSCISTSPRPDAAATSSPASTDVTVRAGAFQLGPIDLLISAGERVAILGANGSGKTTLLNAILGRVSPEQGTVQRGRSVVVGEILQTRDELLAGARATPLLRVFQDLTGLDAGEARTLLAKFGLVADHVLRSSGDAVARRADTRVARRADGPRGQPVGPRRADEPPRSPRHRAVRGRSRGLRRHASCWSPTTGPCSTTSGSPAASSSPAAGSSTNRPISTVTPCRYPHNHR